MGGYGFSETLARFEIGRDHMVVLPTGMLGGRAAREPPPGPIRRRSCSARCTVRDRDRHDATRKQGQKPGLTLILMIIWMP